MARQIDTRYNSLREKISAENKERKERYDRFQAIMIDAMKQAHAKALLHKPTPMHITDGKNNWTISEGVCGFAEIRIPKGNTSFARWAKKNAGFEKHYNGGLSYWVSDYNQSMERKEVFARTVAQILNENGIEAYATSRMD